MIPRRVKLSGFLCYTAEQEVAFDGAPLWMLAGLNGSGKSTIFDAVTYALFGHHRGGAQSATDLINKDSKDLSVEFEFRVEDQNYLIRRTLRRDNKGGAKGTQNISRWESAAAKWAAIPDTNLNEGFKAWIREKIGLNFETFTSSVLLLQGRAEKLLDSKPSGRAEVLAGIVDLERYQKLHEKADVKRKAFKAELDAVQGQVAGVPEVTDFDLLAAENTMVDADEARSIAGKEVERLQHLEFAARQWADAQTRLAGLRERWSKAQTLIAESDVIEQAYRRFCELRDAIPHVLVIQEKTHAAAESERTTQQLLILKENSDARRAELETAVVTARNKKSAHQKAQMKAEQELQGLGLKLRELTGQLSQVRMYEEQSARLKLSMADLARLPADPDGAVRAAQDLYEGRVALSAAVPLIDRFAVGRARLGETTARVGRLHGEEQATLEQGEKAKIGHVEAKTTLAAFTVARQKADEAATEARTLSAQARAAADEFQKNEGAQLCRACGQALTPRHFEAEKAKRTKELKAAGARHQEASSAQTAAQVAETAARDQFEAAEKDLLRLREEYRDTKKEWELAGQDAERLGHECRQAYLSLPDAYRNRVAAIVPADWLSTIWPTADDLAALKREAGDLETARSRLADARNTLARAEKVRTQIATTTKTLDQVKALLPDGDPAKLRDREAQFKGEEEAHTIALRAAKHQIQEADLEVEKLNKAIADGQKALANIDAQLSAEEASRTQFRDAIDRAAKLLPEEWRAPAAMAGLARVNSWKGELDDLHRQGTETRYRELATTRVTVEALRQETADATRLADEFPADARRPAAEVIALLRTAKEAAAARDEDLHQAREVKAVLDRHRRQRDDLRARTLTLEKDLNYAALLAQLLGRDRLQRHLVRTAERQIVDYANGILDRLSGGQLFLRLCGGDDGTGTDRALELEASNRQTGGRAINVAFLSGSQRFRVAVSLALGIGQYASRQHRPIESVIIDEGFGCLDRNGRQVMIQELQNLRGHLQCILLVSHQEEFADAFPDGYRFELADGATKVTRFQR